MARHGLRDQAAWHLVGRYGRRAGDVAAYLARDPALANVVVQGEPDLRVEFVYLAVVLDWFSRRVLSWRLSITMEAAFCIAALEDALARHGKPDIFNKGQPVQRRGVHRCPCGQWNNDQHGRQGGLARQPIC